MPDKRIDSIKFHFEHNTLKLTKRIKLKKYLIQVFKAEHISLAQLNYVFCSDIRLLILNREFLNHDYYTDILTFDLSESSSSVKGEIYISLDRVKDNALRLGEFKYFELHRVIFHGALHLCGYKDNNADEKILMRSKEDFYLSKYFQ